MYVIDFVARFICLLIDIIAIIIKCLRENMYKYLKLSVVEINDYNYPAGAYCNFLDLNEKVVSIIEKLDILTVQNIDKNDLPFNDYLLKCKILKEYENNYKIDISDPYGVLDDNNDFVFTVDKNMLSSNHCDDL